MTVLNAQSNGQNSVCTHALPEGWEWSTVGECFFEMTNGTTISQNRDGCGVPVSRIESIQEARFDLSRMGNVADAPAEIVERFQYRLGDIALSHINSFEHVGKTALYDGIPKVLLHGMNLLRLRLGHEHISSTYAYVFMQSDCFRQGVRDRVTHAVNQVSINQKNLSQVPFPLPPPAEQKRIVAKVEELLERVNASRDRLDRVPKIMKRFRQSVLAAACSGKLTEDWREVNPDVQAMTYTIEQLRITKAAIRTRRGIPESVQLPSELEDLDLPDKWGLESVGDLLRCGALVDVKDGNHGSMHPKASEFTPEGIPFITATQVRDYHIDYETAPKVSGKPLERLRVGFAEVGDAVLTHKGTVGRAAFNTEPCVLTPQTTYYRCNPAILDARYLVYLFTSFQFYRQLAAVMSQTTRDFVPISEQYCLFLVLPPVDEQREIVRRVGALFELANAIEKRVALAKSRADKLPQSILAKAFRGELVPTEAELARREGRDYEPASVLLEKIRAESENPQPMRGKKGQSSISQ